MRRCRGSATLVVLGVAAVMLSACSQDHQELRAWMDEVRRTTPTVREVVEPPKPFVSFKYENSGAVEPFSGQRLQVALLEKPGTGSLQPDLDRPKEPLEAFSLDSFKLVGHLHQGRRQIALMQVDNMVHSVRVGDRLGQNFGRVTNISESEVSVKELVQDAAGDWVERDAALRLQETRP